MLYTGCYESCKGNLCVSISADKGKSASFEGKNYLDLAPKAEFWRTWRNNIGKISEEENTKFYIHEYYNQVLKNLDPYKILKDLDNCIMLCYEKENEFCHRHLVAFWLEEKLKIHVPEVKVTDSGCLLKLERPEYLRQLLLNEMNLPS